MKNSDVEIRFPCAKKGCNGTVAIRGFVDSKMGEDGYNLFLQSNTIDSKCSICGSSLKLEHRRSGRLSMELRASRI